VKINPAAMCTKFASSDFCLRRKRQGLKFLVVCIILILLVGFTACMAEEVSGVWTEVYVPSNESNPSSPTNPPEIQTTVMEDATMENPSTSYDETTPKEMPTDDIVSSEEPTYQAPTDEENDEYDEEYHDEEIEYNPELYDQPIVIAGERGKIAITFDDGPIEYTEQILDILERYGARATFCVLGYRIDDWQDTIQRAVDSGSEVIGHSWAHHNLTRLNAEQIKYQIQAPSAAIEAVIGEPAPKIFRAPYGHTNDRVIEVAEELGYSLLHWSVDPQDWRYRDADHIYWHIMERVTRGAIILLHDIHPSTAEAMETVIPRLVDEGFELVTATELIEYLYGSLEPGKRYVGLRNTQ